PVPGVAAAALGALTHFAVGGLWAQTLVPLSAIRRGFFAICSLSLLAVEGLVLWVLAVAAGEGAGGARPGLPLLGTAAFAASLLSYLLSLGVAGERGIRLTRGVALLLGGGLLVLGAWGNGDGLGVLGFPLRLGDAVLGAALLGLAFVGMLLGHSYLNAPHLPLRLIDRLSRVFLWAVLARGCYPIVAGALLWLAGGLALGEALGGLQEHFLLVILRLGVGVGGSLTAALIIRNCLRLPNVQAATGFYYVAMLTVFLGEVLGRFLRGLADLPL
ncbi:MAG TPA: hypothetical protein VFV36_07945, partial [Candidatus Methylomirabilis sp.]|nr:hypothetical protein [Candidatus Methylomirabilis sp.]